MTLRTTALLLILMLTGCASAPKAPDVDPVAQERAVHDRANALLAEVLPAVNEVQTLLIQNRADEALSKTDALIARYPRVTYLHLVRASALTVLGREDLARDEARKVLHDFPYDQGARQLVDKLGGARTPSSTAH